VREVANPGLLGKELVETEMMVVMAER